VKGHFFQKLVEITRFKVTISKNIATFAQIFPQKALKYTIFFTIQERTKICQMAKSFYLLQTVSKKAKWQ